jgi:3-oxoacyl-[acyl-carrier-protein] synthase II
MNAGVPVAVTGVGVVCALGVGREAYLEGLRGGRCGLRAQPELCVGMAPIVGRVDAPLPVRARMSRADQLALVAAREALADAQVADPAGAVAVVVGVGAGGAGELAAYVRTHDATGPRRARPSQLLAFPPANAADALARGLGLSGPRSSIMTACSASAMALGLALDTIRMGRAQVALAGGAEPLTSLTLHGFAALRALAPEPCRPFDRARRGLSLGEGAAFLLLESAEHAQARGARRYAWLRGFGATCDAHHMTAPEPEGAAAAHAMQAALADAGLRGEELDYVNAHGTGTIPNDLAETRALHRAFGAHAHRLLVSSTKSQIGHTLGAAGALEAAATVLALAHGFAPATVTLEEPDPACDLDYVPRRPRPVPLRAALSSSFGFGGNNVALVFGRDDGV